MSETVTQLLDRYDDDLMELARLSTQGMFDKDLYASASEARQQIVDLVAAARREVETVTRERDEVLVAMEGIVEVYSPNANHSQHMLSRAEYCLKGKRDHIAAHVEGYRQELAYPKTENAALRADLATSRAALEDVLWQEAHPNVEVVSRRRAEDDEKLWVAYDRSGNVNDTEWFAIAEGDTWKEALRNARRALAQEAGDAK